MPRHKLTDDERRKGQAKGAETKRARREAAEAKFLDVVDEAIDCLVAEVRAKGQDRTRAAVHILDRVLGKATQHLEGTLELRRADMVAQAKRELMEEHALAAPAHRAKLEQLLENRARRIADENGSGE
jgi:hypothetical protein